MKQSRALTRRILQTLKENPTCDLDTLVFLCSDLGWNQVFSEIDRLSRSGKIRLSLQSIGKYVVSLPSQCSPFVSLEAGGQHRTDTVPKTPRGEL